MVVAASAASVIFVFIVMLLCSGITSVVMQSEYKVDAGCGKHGVVVDISNHLPFLLFARMAFAA